MEEITPPDDHDQPPPLVTTAELASLMRCTRQTILNWVKAGKLSPAVSVGGTHRFYLPTGLLPIYKGEVRQ
jgi:excisionase family DNA binding protein